MYTYHIHINGSMEDTGFMAAIHQLASSFDLKGRAIGASNRLLVTCNAYPETAYQFYQRILEHAPGNFTVVSHHMAAAPKEEFDCFSIHHSDADPLKDLFAR